MNATPAAIINTDTRPRHTPVSTPAVRFRGVGKGFRDTTVLADLDLDIGKGELVSLLGPSGCGKTTTLRLLAGFEHPDSGVIELAGKDITQLPAHKRDIGMVFQSYSLFPNLSVAGNVDYGLQVRKLPRAERESRIDRMLDLCGLGQFAKRLPHELSGGQQQRVALARALAVEPSVLVLDEPLSALDAGVRSKLRAEIRALQQQLETTMLFVTHDQAEALAISDRVAVMNAGRIEQLDTPQTVYETPANAFVARFVGTATELRVPTGWSGGPLPLDTVGDEVVFVRPEYLRFAAHELGRSVVTEHSYTGERTSVRARLDSGGMATASMSANDAANLEIGTRVTLEVVGPIAFRQDAGQ